MWDGIFGINGQALPVASLWLGLNSLLSLCPNPTQSYTPVQSIYHPVLMQYYLCKHFGYHEYICLINHTWSVYMTTDILDCTLFTQPSV